MKTLKSEEMSFQPRARIMLQLGEQLIRNESIALNELVKNSYDADARNVTVSMKNINDPKNGEIIIEDDGEGMDFDIVTKVWMELGSDNKEKLVKKNKQSLKFHRLPLGEKGIGRFGAHKLGNMIELVTKSEKRAEVYLKIDWTLFQKKKYLKDVPITIHERKAEVFLNSKTGTKIIIRDLKTKWDRGMVRDIYRSVNSLCSFFSAPSSFRPKIVLHDHKDWLKGILSWKDIKELALYHTKCSIVGDKIRTFSYEFTPWDTMPKLNPRIVTQKDEFFIKKQEMVKEVKVDGKKTIKSINLLDHNIGEIKFEAYVFDRSAKILSLGLEGKKGFKEYLNQNGGMRVYRDRIRVYDYGEPGNDWLELGMRRVNIPTKRISNNIVLGAIHLKRNQSTSLVEKTNREGFIENDAYHTFCEAIIYAIGVMEGFRNPDKDRLQALYGSSPKSEPVLASLAKLREVVNAKIKNPDTKSEFVKYIDRIERDYEYINDNLLKSAGAGLNLSIVIHEFEKIIGELLQVLKKDKASERLLYLARHLSNLVEGYTLLIRGSGSKKESLAEIIDQSLFNVEFRLRAHEIDVVLDYDKPLSIPKVKCAKRFVINSIMNIIDNSIWWLNYYKIEKKKLYLTISEEVQGHTSIIIADNGKGFSLPTEEMIMPYMSGKPPEIGMGIGLHIVSETMKAQKGILLFPEWGDFSIPGEFREGAKISLCFKH